MASCEAWYDEAGAELLLRWLCCTEDEGDDKTIAEVEVGETEEMGLGAELKLGQVPRFKCSEAVREGLEAEKMASHKEHLSFTALGSPVSVL